MDFIIRWIVNCWNGGKVVVPLVGILACTWALVSLVTSGAYFQDALALGCSNSDLTEGAQITRYALLTLFATISIAYTGHKQREAVDLALSTRSHNKSEPAEDDSIFGDS